MKAHMNSLRFAPIDSKGDVLKVRGLEQGD